MSKSEPQEQDLTAELKENARQWGADLVGVADTALLQGIDTRPEDLLDDFPRAVSVAVRLSDAVMNPIDDRPTELYAAHYQRVNDLLDRIALRVTNFLQDRGAHALPLPASQILDEEVFYSYLSHKAVAVAAALWLR
jgi:epoxyqueuosine reductase QueG